MMLMPASAEFAALCQAQIAMIAGVVGADSTAVYLAESWSDQAMPKLIPIAIYPVAAAMGYPPMTERALPGMAPQMSGHGVGPERPTMAAANPIAPTERLTPELLSTASLPHPAEAAAPQRLAIPLMHEGGVFGVLVGWRADRPWQAQDRDRMEACARSLTLACVLDQRGQWLKTRLTALDRVQTQQSDRFHELLHQLRSPLTALKTFGKLLTKRMASEDQNQGLVRNMLREGDRLQELLSYFDDTLQAADESREETATTVPLLAPAAADIPAIASPPTLAAKADSLAHFGGVLTLQAWAIAPLLTPLIELTQPLAEDAGMTFEMVAPAAAVWVEADAKALLEILNNFIDNALKYATPGTHIWLQWGIPCPTQPTLTGILVGDTGPGIPTDDQGHIFERHYRGVQAAGSQAGSGLGLAIAADLVHEMHGQIAVFSPLSTMPWPLPSHLAAIAAGRGTAFVIWLPQATI